MHKFIDNDTCYYYKGYVAMFGHADNFIGYYSSKDCCYYALKKRTARDFISYINNYKRSYYYL